MKRKPVGGILAFLRTVVPAEGADLVSDGQLLERFTTLRDEAAFELLLWRYGRMVMGVCRRLLPNPPDAEDAFQAAFLILARRAASIRSRTSIGGWLYRVAYRVALESRQRLQSRGNREEPLGDFSPPAPTLSPETEAGANELRTLLDEEINRLPETYRVPFVLCHLQGKGNAEIAGELGCAVGTVESRLVRARQRLRTHLARRGVGFSAGMVAALVAQAEGPVFTGGPLVAATVRAVMGVGGSAQVLALTKGVLHTMWLAKLKNIAVVVVVAVLLTGGVGGIAYGVLTEREERQPPPAQARTPQKKEERAPLDPLAQAQAAAERLADPAQRVVVLVRVAAVRGLSGDKAGAKTILEQATRAVPNIEVGHRQMAYREIGTTYLRMGEASMVHRLADDAPKGVSRNDLLFLMAADQAEHGDIAGASATAEKIDDDHKTGVLAAIASAQARAGRIDEALKIAETLRVEPLDRATALEAIALAQGKAGQREPALRTLKEALELQVNTLAQEASRQQARVGVAILQAQLGDIDGALKAATALGNTIAEGYSDRSAALQGIALEQAGKKDLEGALQTVAMIEDAGRRAVALIAVGNDRAKAEDLVGARLCLTQTRDLIRTLPVGSPRKNVEAEATGLEVKLQVRAGEMQAALKTARAIKYAFARGQMMLDIARLQAKRGDQREAVTTLKQAVEAVDSMKDDRKDPMGVQTLAPQWLIFKGHLARQVAKALAEFGAFEEARTWATREEQPYVQALMWLGLAEGKK